jgi:hypothetical protein
MAVTIDLSGRIAWVTGGVSGIATPTRSRQPSSFSPPLADFITGQVLVVDGGQLV